MRVVPLRLHRRPQPGRPATAWLVPGHSPAEWLANIANWPVQQAALRCLVLTLKTEREGEAPAEPCSFQDAGTTSGSAGASPSHVADALLVLLTEPLPDTFRPERCQPYGAVTPNLFVPVEAAIEPALIAEEWSSLLPGRETISVWRAQGDLIGFEPGDIVTIADLLTANVDPTPHWTAARDAPAFVTRLRSITSSMPIPSLEEVTAQWQNDVGTNDAPGKIPPLADEPPLHWTERLANSTAGIRRVWNRFAAGMSRYGGLIRAAALGVIAVIALFALMNLGNMSLGSLPELLAFIAIAALAWALLRWGMNYGGAGPAYESASSSSSGSSSGAFTTGLSRFWNWFRSGVQSIAPRGMSFSPFEEANRRQREREIRRLLQMLSENPAEGLRYAIPFGGDIGRGVARAGNQLVARDLTFRLGTGGGVAADYWDISAEHQLKLTASYRTLAEREQQAGRHRRAAYIYSQLLNDWRSAATALVAGHHYAEAAVIYEKRLKIVGEAAKYYELAGQFEKALQLYIDSTNWIAAGDLCTRAERLDEARTHYRAAVSVALTAKNLPYAAELLEQKLEAVDEALVLLEHGWPGDSRADACLDAWFDLTARHHRPHAAIARIESLSESTSQSAALRLLPRWLRVHQRYPDAMVQQQSAEWTLRIIARHLAHAAPPVAQELTSFLPALVPSDRLLSRDCQRYVETARSLVPRQQQLPLKPKIELRLVHKHELPESSVVSVLASPHGWAILMEPTYVKPQELVLTSWKETNEVTVVPLKAGRPASRLIAASGSLREIWMRPPYPNPTRLPWPSASENWHIVCPEFLPDHTVAAVPGQNGTRVLWFDEFFAAWLSFYTGKGENVRSFRIAEEWLGDPKQVVPLLHGRAAIHSLGENETMTFLPVGNGQIFGEHFSSEGIRQWADLFAGEEVVCDPVRDSRTVLVLQKEAVLFVEDVRRMEATHRIFSGWHNPKAAILVASFFVIVDEHRVALFRLHDNTPVAECAHVATRPLAVTPCGMAQFSVLRSDGTIEAWAWA